MNRQRVLLAMMRIRYSWCVPERDRAPLVWLGSLGPTFWAVANGDWSYVADLPKVPS